MRGSLSVECMETVLQASATSLDIRSSPHGAIDTPTPFHRAGSFEHSVLHVDILQSLVNSQITSCYVEYAQGGKHALSAYGFVMPHSSN